MILCLPCIKSLDWGLDATNSHVVGGAPRYGFDPLQGMMTMPIPEPAVPNNDKVGNQVLSWPTLPVHRVSFRLMYLVSSGFSFKPS